MLISHKKLPVLLTLDVIEAFQFLIVICIPLLIYSWVNFQLLSIFISTQQSSSFLIPSLITPFQNVSSTTLCSYHLVLSCNHVFPGFSIQFPYSLLPIMNSFYQVLLPSPLLFFSQSTTRHFSIKILKFSLQSS